MISFCEKEIIYIYEDELDIEKLYSFFSTKESSTSIVLVKDKKDQFIGIITYERLLYKKEDLIQKQTLKAGDDIWYHAELIFKNNKNLIYIPIFDENNKLIYFCYKSVVHRETETKMIIKDLYDNEELFFIKELFPKVQVVYLHDLNEMAFRFYELLKKREIPVVTVGEKWKDLLGIETEDIICPDYARMNVYAEGTPLILDNRDYLDNKRFTVPNVWGFLTDIANMNRIILENRIKEEYNNLGMKVYICRIPEYSQLSNCTIDEEYRYLKQIHLLNHSLDFSDKAISNQIYNIYKMEYHEIIDKLDVKEAIKKRSAIHKDKIIKKQGTGDSYIYLIGPCIVNGHSNLEEEQLSYFLNQELDDNNMNYTIKGIALSEEQCNNLIQIVSSLSINNKDIIILIGHDYQSIRKKYGIDDKADLNLIDVFNSRNKNETWFMDLPIHTTGEGNKYLSKAIFDKIIRPELNKMKLTQETICLQKGKVNLSEKELNDLKLYIQGIEKNKFNVYQPSKIGSIVMNCNPLTLGHMYLIEYARSQVDYLYIFIVEEDKSFFKFQDRYSLVKKATEDMDNVQVIPSGQFILSNKTLPSYFTKEYQKEQIIDASEDIGLFAEYIAPALNIKVRFVGEEPLDPITNQYNMEMRRTLKDYEIEFIEIPRKEISGKVISASKVRKLLFDGDLDSIKKIVPKVTYEYLQNWKHDKC